MRTIKAPNEQGKIIECVLLNVHGYQLGTGCVALFEDLNDYGAVYEYDADRKQVHKILDVPAATITGRRGVAATGKAWQSCLG